MAFASTNPGEYNPGDPPPFIPVDPTTGGPTIGTQPRGRTTQPVGSVQSTYGPNQGADPSNPYGWNGTSYTNPPKGYHWDDSMANFVQDPAAAGGNDLASLLSGVYAKYGLDPSNPGQGLGNLDYFLGRANATNPNDTQYWQDRLDQEIQKWKNGTIGNLIPNEGGGGGGMLLGSGDGGQLSALMQQLMAQQAADAQMRDQFRQSILSQLDKLQNDTTATDPNGPQLSPIINAYHLQSQRGLQNTRNALAEQNYAAGTTNTGGFATQQQRALEDASANEANFTGQQVSQAVQARQAQLQHLLDVGAGFLSQGEQQGIQLELASLQAQLQREALAQQNNQFNNSLGFNYTQLQAMLNQNSILQALGLL